jgi:hypothetical protein
MSGTMRRCFAIKVDARADGTEIGLALVKVVELGNQKLEYLKKGAKSGVHAAAAFSALYVGTESVYVALSAAMKTLLADDKTSPEILGPAALETLAQAGHSFFQGKFHTVLIVDEANLFLKLDPMLPKDQYASRKREILAVLEKMVELTKQTKKITVILVSSDYGFPYLLSANDDPVTGKNTGLGFNSYNFTHTVVAGEVPPAAMRELLMCKIGMREGLTDLMLATYGGHIHTINIALGQLKPTFRAELACPVSLSGNILSCIDQGPRDMIPLLRGVAINGFHPLTHYQSVSAELATRCNVIGVVNSSSTVHGLSIDRFDQCNTKYAALPCFQFARLVIADVLRTRGLMEDNSEEALYAQKAAEEEALYARKAAEEEALYAKNVARNAAEEEALYARKAAEEEALYAKNVARKALERQTEREERKADEKALYAKNVARKALERQTEREERKADEKALYAKKPALFKWMSSWFDKKS